MPDGIWTTPKSILPPQTVRAPRTRPLASPVTAARSTFPEQIVTAPRSDMPRTVRPDPDQGLGKIQQFVTLVAKGGVPSILCDAFGNPYPTTGYGALVFGEGAVLNDCLIHGTVFYDVQFPELLKNTGDFVSYDESVQAPVTIPMGMTGQVLTAGVGPNGNLGWTYQGTGTVQEIHGGPGMDLQPTDPIVTIGTIGLAPSGATAGVYGSASEIPQFNVDQYGRITSITEIEVHIPPTTTVAAGNNITVTGTPPDYTVSLSTSPALVTPTITTDPPTPDNTSKIPSTRWTNTAIANAVSGGISGIVYPAKSVLYGSGTSGSNAAKGDPSKLAFDEATTSLTVGGASVLTNVTASTGITVTGTGATRTVAMSNQITAAGPIGSATAVPVLTYNAQGQLTAVTTAAITPPVIGAAPGVVCADSPPTSPAPVDGQLWWDSVAGQLMVRFNDGDSVQWVIASPGLSNPGPPPGSITDYAGTTVPTGWYACDGSIKDRTIDPALFTAIGTAYNIGGESGTQFRVPNMAGYVRAGVDPSALRLPGMTTVGAVSGAATVTLAVAQMPAHAHGDAGHAHGDSGHGHSISDGGHNHYINQAGHQHAAAPNATGTGWNAGCGCTGGGSVLWADGGRLDQTDWRTTGDYNSASGTGIGIYAGYANIATNYASIQNTGGGGSHLNVQPTIAMLVIIKR